jgi:hypothetical protein
MELKNGIKMEIDNNMPTVVFICFQQIGKIYLQYINENIFKLYLNLKMILKKVFLISQRKLML